MKKMVADAGLAAGYKIDSAGIGDWHVGQLPDSRMRNCGARRFVPMFYVSSSFFVFNNSFVFCL